MVECAFVLEGGALRCLFTAGVLDVLMEQDVEASCVIGVSAGALSGVNYLSKQVGRTAKINIRYMQDKRYFSAQNWLQKKGFFKCLFPSDYPRVKCVFHKFQGLLLH